MCKNTSTINSHLDEKVLVRLRKYVNTCRNNKKKGCNQSNQL